MIILDYGLAMVALRSLFVYVYLGYYWLLLLLIVTLLSVKVTILDVHFLAANQIFMQPFSAWDVHFNITWTLTGQHYMLMPFNDVGLPGYLMWSIFIGAIKRPYGLNNSWLMINMYKNQIVSFLKSVHLGLSGWLTLLVFLDSEPVLTLFSTSACQLLYMIDQRCRTYHFRCNFFN